MLIFPTVPLSECRAITEPFGCGVKAPVTGPELDEVLTNLNASYIGAIGAGQRRSGSGAGFETAPLPLRASPYGWVRVTRMNRLAAAVMLAVSITSIGGCAGTSGDSYPLLTRFPDPPMVLSAAEWQRIRETLLADHQVGAAAAADHRPTSTP